MWRSAQLQLLASGEDVFDHRLHPRFVGERREHVALERHDRLAVVGLAIAIRQRDRHAAAGQRLGVHPAKMRRL